jgi:serine/threonine-protein kinase
MVGLEQYIGSVLAQRYRIDRPIGAGGMGAVFEAFQLDLGRRVALKLLLGAAEKGDLARFKTEALSVAAASHVNVVQLFEFSVEHDPPFLTMELLEGQTLHARMKEGALPVKAAIDIAVQILSALQTAHAAGVVHRDLKPSNIFLTSNVLGIDLVKVLDFGIAKLAGTAALTATGAVVGTPAYMAPEQILGEEVDARSDVHAVGILLLEMIAGQRAFAPGVDIAMRVVREAPPRLDALRPSVPRVVADVVARALSKEPAARFEDARAMLAALDACRASLAEGAPPADFAATTVSKTERTDPSTVREAATALEPRTQLSPSTAPLGAAPATALPGPLPEPAPARVQAQPPAQHRPPPQAPRTSPPARPSGGRRMLVFVLVPAALLVVLGGVVVVLLFSHLKSQLDDEREAVGKLAFRPCPPPTTCNGTLTVMNEKRAFCTSPPSASVPPYANGDAVYIRDGKVTAFAHLTSTNRNGTFKAERLSGYTLDVSTKEIFGRACRP